MILLLLNLFLIGVYCLMGFIALCITLAVVELIKKVCKPKSVKIPYGNKGQFVKFISYDLSGGEHAK